MKRYNLGEGAKVSNNVVIERNHYLEGFIQIGENVLISKNVYIDYSGELTIEDSVGIANGVIIETHHRDLEAKLLGKDVNIPTRLLIRKNAYIGARAIILDSCNYIGLNARIGAGAVVTKDVPDNSVVVGVPAKVVKYRFDEATIRKMLEKQWWNGSEEELKEVERNFLDVETFLKDIV